jgi:phosphohistidine phosphatase SixA
MGRDVVVDSANLTAAERTEWISGAKAVADVSPSVVICGHQPSESEVRPFKVLRHTADC